MIDYAKENLSAKQSSTGEDTWIQSTHGNQERPSGAKEAAGKGTQTADPCALLIARRLTKDERLQNSSQFRCVYNRGTRYDGPLMSVFVLPNALGFHRFGVTASRKMSHSAVKRNRAKRLLREAFRLGKEDLDGLRFKYDWVFNARRSLLKIKLAEPLKELREIVARVSRDELKNS